MIHGLPRSTGVLRATGVGALVFVVLASADVTGRALVVISVLSGVYFEAVWIVATLTRRKRADR